MRFKRQKFQTLYEQIPFLADKTYLERTWWIRYYKLKHTWITNFPMLNFYPDEYIEEIFQNKNRFEYNSKIVEYDTNNPFERMNALPWDKPNYKHGCFGHNHQLNADLNDIEWLFSQLKYDWVHVRLEEIIWPGMVECSYNVFEDCNNCKYRFKCELRGE